MEDIREEETTETNEILLTEEHVIQLANALGLPEIVASIERLSNITSDLLLYMNNIEQIALQYEGDPVVTQKVTASQTNRGLQIERERPLVSALDALGNIPGMTGKKGIVVNNG